MPKIVYNIFGGFVKPFFIGLDDTDTLESRGTGQLARHIAAVLVVDYPVLA